LYNKDNENFDTEDNYYVENCSRQPTWIIPFLFGIFGIIWTIINMPAEMTTGDPDYKTFYNKDVT